MEFENLLKLVEAVSESKLTGFKYEENGVKISFSKKNEMIRAEAPAPSAVEVLLQGSEDAEAADRPAPAKTENGQIVKAPLVGVFYAAPAEGAKPFVSVGDRVTKGQTLAIIEAMKLMNEIESDFDGTVAEIYVSNEQVVEYGQPLLRIEP